MSGWITLWTWTFGLSVVLFFLVEVVVVVGGAADIRAMLKTLAEQAKESSGDQ